MGTVRDFKFSVPNDRQVYKARNAKVDQNGRYYTLHGRAQSHSQGVTPPFIQHQITGSLHIMLDRRCAIEIVVVSITDTTEIIP